MSAGIANTVVAAAVVLTGLSVLLAILGTVAFRRVGHVRLLWVATAFVLLAGQGVYFTRVAYLERATLTSFAAPLPFLILINLAIVMALYFAVLKR